jgi:hypothetical protein
MRNDGDEPTTDAQVPDANAADGTPALSAEDHALIASLRALPPEGSEPNWAAMARAISDEVGPTVPRRFWQRWLVPVAALATTAAAAMLWLRHPDRDASLVAPPAPSPIVHHAEPENPPPPLWLDGHLVDMNELSPEAIDDFVDESSDEIVPGAGLQIVDEFDDQALDRVESWLSHERT